MKFAKYAVKNSPDSQVESELIESKIEDIYNEYSNMRSEVIDAALHIENTLTIILLHFFVGEDYKKHRLLRAFIFEAEFCSFMQKRKMLGLLFEQFSNQITVLNDAESKLLRREISSIIEMRNIFAHGHIYIDAQDFSVYIKHYQSGPKEVKITKATLDEYIKKCDTCHRIMSELNTFVRANQFELK
jgi:hypothetical protein